MINFCPLFFSKPSLSEAMADGSGRTDNSKFDLDTYENRAAIIYHEMTHLDLAANSSGENTPNPRITDLKIEYVDGRYALENESIWGVAHEDACSLWAT